MTAHLYLAEDGFMAFECERFFLKFLVPKALTKINEIKTFDDGYLVIDTNYGEEYVDLHHIADEINLRVNFSDLNPIVGGA